MVKEQPKIIYGGIEQSIHPNAEYLFMKAGITNKTYSTKDFLELINNVSLDEITKEECKKELEQQRNFLTIIAPKDNEVIIKNYNPNKERLEKFVNTTFKEMILTYQKNKY